LNAIVMQVADDLLTGRQDIEKWWDRYPDY
jgi:hypothetical protein